MASTYGEPGLRVTLAAFLGVCTLADMSPIAKLHPPSVVLSALVAGADGPRETREWLVYGTVVAIAIALPTFALGWIARWRSLPVGSLARFTSVAMAAGMFAVARIVVHRAQTLRTVNRGSDMADCIEMPARALLSGHWPYDRTLIWSGNPCSPGMGWIALAAPFVISVGYAVFLVAGAIAFVALPKRILGAREVMAFLALTLSCVTAWQSLATGADALAIGVGLALVTTLSASARATMPVVGLAVLAGLLATARLPLAFFPFLIGAFLVAEGERRRAALFVGVAIATLALAHGAPLLVNARSYVDDGPFHVLGKAARIAGAGQRLGWAIFGACGLAWIAYATWCLRRLSKRPPSLRARLFDTATLTLLTIAGPTLASLVSCLRAPPPWGGWTALQRWEGGWLLFALPCYAAALAMAFRDADARSSMTLPNARS